MSRCKHCDQKILWGIRSKYWIPLDPDPSPDGRWVKIDGKYVELSGVARETAMMLKHKMHSAHRCQGVKNVA